MTAPDPKLVEIVARALKPEWWNDAAINGDGWHALDNYQGQHLKYREMSMEQARAALTALQASGYEVVKQAPKGDPRVTRWQDRDAEVLAFIGRYLEANGKTPTQREISDEMGWKERSCKRVESSLRRLAAAGHLTRSRKGWRNIELTAAPD